MVTRYNIKIDIWGRDIILKKMRDFAFFLFRKVTNNAKKSKLLTHDKFKI